MTPDPSRARRLLIALAICAAILAALAGWVATSRGGEKAASVVSFPETHAQTVELSAAPADSERLDLSTSISVSSRAGLPIESVFLAAADGVWRPHKASEGRIERAELKDVTRICAPGHVPASLDARASSIVLDVDAMLVVRCPGLKACLSGASPIDGRRNGFAACAGFLDDDTLGCAVACALRPAGARGDAVAFDLAWHDRLMTRIQFRPELGKTVEWQTSCPSAPPTSELVLGLVRNGAEGFVVKVNGRIEPLAGARPSTEGAGPGAMPLQSEIAFPWGTAVTAWRPFDVAQTAVGGANEVRIVGVPLGAKVSLTAQDPDFGGWGMLACFHDGSGHEVVLRPLVKLHGKITVADDSALPDHVDVAWFERFAVAEDPAWETTDSTAYVAKDGSWSVSGPRRMRCGAASSSVVPPFAEVQITAPGFRSVTIRQATADVQDLELETVQLEPFAPDLLIRPRSEEGLDGFHNRFEVSAQSGTGRIDSLRIARVWRRDDGMIALWFRRTESWSSGADRDRVAPIVAGAVRLVTTTQWREWRGFVRTADGTFEEIDSETYELDLVLPKDSERVWMRMTWYGIDCESKLLIPRLDKVQMQSLKMPIGPVEIRWKCAKPGSEWSSAPLVPGRQRFERIACPLERNG